jgi:hypothetical protein
MPYFISEIKLHNLFFNLRSLINKQSGIKIIHKIEENTPSQKVKLKCF